VTANYCSVDAIIAYEQGALNEDEILELFQYLLDTGLIKGLQGHYQRTAQFLLEEGYIA